MSKIVEKLMTMFPFPPSFFSFNFHSEFFSFFLSFIQIFLSFFLSFFSFFLFLSFVFCFFFYFLLHSHLFFCLFFNFCFGISVFTTLCYYSFEVTLSWINRSQIVWKKNCHTKKNSKNSKKKYLKKFGGTEYICSKEK